MTNPESRQALYILYRDHHAWLVRMLQRQLGNTAQAADIAQDTFMRLLQADVRPNLVSPRGYLTTIARNLLRNQYHRAQLEQAYCDSLQAAPMAHAPSPEEILQATQALQQVWDMLDGLPHRTRQIFMMARMAGMSHRDIAGELGISVRIVENNVIKATRHCYDILYT